MTLPFDTHLASYHSCTDQVLDVNTDGAAPSFEAPEEHNYFAAPTHEMVTLFVAMASAPPPDGDVGDDEDMSEDEDDPYDWFTAGMSNDAVCLNDVSKPHMPR